MMNIINQTDASLPLKEITRVIKAAYKLTGTPKKRCINLVFTQLETIKSLNRTFREIDRPTDVLSFPSDIDDEIGDVFIAVTVAKQQAEENGHSLTRELAFLAVHGFLHCIGYDHDDPQEAEIMFATQERILEHAKIPRPR